MQDNRFCVRPFRVFLFSLFVDDAFVALSLSSSKSSPPMMIKHRSSLILLCALHWGASAVQEERRAIVGGTAAIPGRFPYYTRLDYNGDFFCGGSLIHSDLVLTAAHCVSEADVGSVTVTVGAITLPHNADAALDVPTVTRAATQVFRHPTYDDSVRGSLINDFAIMKIDPIPDDEFKPVAWNRNKELVEPGIPLTTIGLGYTNNVDERPADFLQQVELKVVADEECDSLYQGMVHRKSMICTSDAGKDSCLGDSGGPLIMLGESETGEDDIQVGVVSFGGESCADLANPGVYSQIDYVSHWIDRTICEESTAPPEHCEYFLENLSCEDLPGAFYASWWYQFQRCEWLKGRLDFCEASNEAWVQCPLSCHSCTYNLDDDVPFDGVTVYNKSSSQVAFIFIFLLTSVICCMCCCQAGYFFRNRFRRK